MFQPRPFHFDFGPKAPSQGDSKCQGSPESVVEEFTIHAAYSTIRANAGN
jgi:hypothetical protein